VLPPCTSDVDCTVSAWQAWGDCSCTCEGLQERVRVIAAYRKGNGKNCSSDRNNDVLREMRPCNPTEGLPPPKACLPGVCVDCQFDGWGSWSPCSVSCGVGMQRRTRLVGTAATPCGKQCVGPSSQFQACDSGEPCKAECIDCEMSIWSAWSVCPACGATQPGQQLRTRQIKVHPNYCGNQCVPGSLSETKACSQNCDVIKYCVWSKYQPAIPGRSGCTTTCGPGAKTQSRQLMLVSGQNTSGYVNGQQIFFQVLGDDICADKGDRCEDPQDICSGSQETLVDCQNQDCPAPCNGIKTDCTYGEWSIWDPEKCTGLCHRSRTATVGNACGQQCEGSVSETKLCNTPDDACKDRNCSWGMWTGWSDCTDVVAAKYQQGRSRESGQKLGNGFPCVGASKQTRPCGGDIKVDCRMLNWMQWDACSKSCGGGYRQRKRRISQEAVFGGKPCIGELKLYEACQLGECPCTPAPLNCSFGSWSAWAPDVCTTDGKQSRNRAIVQAAQYRFQGCGGHGCEGGMSEYRPCTPPPVNCTLSVWAAWSPCDRTCDSGQKSRDRAVHATATNGGFCHASLAETAACLAPSCGGDCLLSPWTEWGGPGECTPVNGNGQETRRREMAENSKDGGLPCNGSMIETRGCHGKRSEPTRHPAVDGKWSAWGVWSGCSCTCGNGTRMRERAIAVMPRYGGKILDPGPVHEVGACKEASCDPDCVDGRWGDWGIWSLCSATCEGGVTHRLRAIVGLPNFCGKSASGQSRETNTCSEKIGCTPSKDCEFANWSPWAACMHQNNEDYCDGHHRRTRRIQTHGQGHGKHCVGSTMEIAPCEPCKVETPPPPVECKWSVWSDWDLCTVTCDTGQHKRSRTIEAAQLYGGKACSGSLSDIQACEMSPCLIPVPVDCVWGGWNDWSVCSDCARGHRTRARLITVHPKNAGKPCESHNSREVGTCTFACPAETFCGWTVWAAWSSCSATCMGSSTRSRQLEVKVGAGPDLTKLEEVNSNLLETTARLEASRVQEIVTAFAAGCLSLVIALVMLRIVRRSRGGDAPRLAQLSHQWASGAGAYEARPLTMPLTMSVVE